MDIAYYISDLLGQQGEVTVPNLGYFVQIRMPAYYDSQAKKFFPPHYAVQFDPQVIDEDESLANHISAIKKISPSSAKYFIEKYTGNLKSQAVIEDVALENLGTFSSDGLKMTFQSATKSNDPSFFAYQPVTVFKIGEAKIKPEEVVAPIVIEAPEPEPVAPAEKKPFSLFNSQSPKPVVPAAVAERAPVRVTDEDEDDDDELAAEPKGLGLWIIVLIAFTVLIIALGALYKFKPDMFKFLKHKQAAAPYIAPVVVKKEPVADTSATQTSLTKDSVTVDTPKPADNPSVTKKTEDKPVETKKTETVVTKPAETKKPDAVVSKPVDKPVVVKKQDVVVNTPPKSAPPVTTPVNNTPTSTASPDGLTKGDWVIHAGSGPDKKPMERAVEQLKTKGFANAHLERENVKNGNNYKVMIGGTYKTKAEAADAAKELTASGKIKITDLSIDQL